MSIGSSRLISSGVTVAKELGFGRQKLYDILVEVE